MKQQSEIQYDAVSALIQGARDYQEDALVADFPLGSDVGMIVLSDGMGGHAAGDVASKIVMTEVYSELKFQSGDPGAFEEFLPEILLSAAQSANDCINAHIDDAPESAGMGATLLSAVITEGRLYWISVGDSPLYLFRDNTLHQLNEDHSMAPQIDLMVLSGMMDPDTARNHPDRNALTSVLSGDEIPKIDCPLEGIELCDGDIIVAASDGLQFLEEDEIMEVIAEHCEDQSADLARTFLKRIEELGDPEQDNTSLAVVKIQMPKQVETHCAIEVLDGQEDGEDDDSILPRRVQLATEPQSERPVRIEAQQ